MCKKILRCGFPYSVWVHSSVFGCLTLVDENHLYLSHKPRRNNMWEQRSAFLVVYSFAQMSANNSPANISAQ